jgi:hypothetical protein
LLANCGNTSPALTATIIVERWLLFSGISASLFPFLIFSQKKKPVMPLQVGVPFDCPLCAVELFSGSPGSSLTSIASVKFGDVRGSLHGPGAIDRPGVQVKLFNVFFEFKLGRRVT